MGEGRKGEEGGGKWERGGREKRVEGNGRGKEGRRGWREMGEGRKGEEGGGKWGREGVEEGEENRWRVEGKDLGMGEINYDIVSSMS